MPKRIDLVGMRFSRLLVVERVNGSIWRCICDCGAEVITLSHPLKHGRTKSCGCYSRDRTTKHGMEGSRVYVTWSQMRTRCENPNNKEYKNYGGRGIKVCAEWLDFKTFYADMGDKPEGMTLDRIDNNGDYCKSNCRWVPQKEQIRNRRVTPMFKGESLAAHAERHGIPWRRVYERVRAGWSPELALETPVAKRTKH